MEKNEYYQLLNYNALVHKRPIIRQMVHYYPNEVFAKTPLINNIIIGNFGTIIDERTGMKCVPWFDQYNNPTINIKEFVGDKFYKKYKVCRLVMLAHSPIPEWKSRIVFHLDGNPTHNIYAPGTAWNNLIWVDDHQYHKLLTLRRYHQNKLSSDIDFLVSSMEDSVVESICKLYSQGYNTGKIMSILGMDDSPANRHKLNMIKLGKAKRYISSKYDMPKPATRISHTAEEVEIVCRYLDKYVPLKMTIADITRKIQMDGYSNFSRRFVLSIYSRETKKWDFIISNHTFWRH